MMKILSLHDFDGPAFGDIAAVGLLNNIVHYCSYDKLQDENQPFRKYLRNYPEVSLIQDIPATRDSMRTVSASELFLPVHDSAIKKIASIWREKGFSEAIRFAAAADPQEITTVVHWIATRYSQYFYLTYTTTRVLFYSYLCIVNTTMVCNFRLRKALDLMERGIYHTDRLPVSGDGSVADIATTRDWNTSLVG